MQEVVLISIPVNDLQTLIIDSVNDCLKKANPKLLTDNLSEIPEMLTRREAAKLLSISLGTLDSWAKEGRVTKHRAGGVVRFRKDELLSNFKSLNGSKYQRF